MCTKKVVSQSVLILLSALTIFPATANHKCIGPDGKIEYRDQACVQTVKVAASANATEVAKPLSGPMERLNVLFTDYEARLCERERLVSEIDRAARSGKPQAPNWNSKEDRLRELNEELIQFQAKQSKITNGKAFESEELVALRQFQAKTRKCGKLAS
jgi:hypothetical protein